MPLPSIKDEQILTQLASMLDAVTPGQDYYLGFDKVYVEFANGNAAIPERLKRIGNVRFSDDSLLELISEAIEDITAIIEIDLIIKNTDEILRLKADTLKAIGQDVTLGGLVFNIEYMGAAKNKTDHYGNKISDLTISLKITYRRKAWSN